MSGRIAGVEPKVYNGVEYKSTFEANTAQLLDTLGIPWEYETRTYTILEGFYCPWQKRKVMGIEYIPDFIIGPLMLETKGWETPEWKIKKKFFFKYLKENEPDALWYMVHSEKEILQVLDKHWSYLGYAIQVTPQPPKPKKSRKKAIEPKAPVPVAPALYDSIKQAFLELNLKNKSITPILRCLTGKKEWAYGYNWKLKKLNL